MARLPKSVAVATLALGAAGCVSDATAESVAPPAEQKVDDAKPAKSKAKKVEKVTKKKTSTDGEFIELSMPAGTLYDVLDRGDIPG